MGVKFLAQGNNSSRMPHQASNLGPSDYQADALTVRFRALHQFSVHGSLKLEVDYYVLLPAFKSYVVTLALRTP